MQRTAFEGKVTFDVVGANTLREVVVSGGFKRAIGEHITFEGEEAILFSNAMIFLSRTKDITAENTDNPDVLALMEFWSFANLNTDYRAIWNAFLFLSTDVNNEWITVINTVISERLKAPDYVRPTAPNDEQLELTGAGRKKKPTVTDT